ncbi:energy transducer TonB, partial [Myxococcota bacterium]
LHQAMPEAFGPNGDKAVVEFLHQTLMERMLERRAMLRMAEEIAEKSSIRTSDPSVPPVATTTATTMATAQPATQKPSRRSLVLAGISAAAVAAVIGFEVLRHLDRPTDPRVGATQEPMTKPMSTKAKGVSEAVSVSDGPVIPATAIPVTDVRSDKVPEPSLAADPGAAGMPVARPAPDHSNVPGEQSRSSPAEELDEPAIEEPGEAANPAVGDAGSRLELKLDAGLEPTDGAEPTRLLPRPSPPAGPGPLHPTGRQPRQPEPAAGPRLLSSRTAHARLAINPNAEPFRVDLPPVLARLGRTFTAKVRICVSPRGDVTSVDVVRSAGPAIDPKIPNAVGRWRYRPLIEDGRAVPFCYLLQYAISPG